MNEKAEDKPPLSDSKGSRSPAGNCGIDFSYLYRIPIWRGGNLAGMGIYGDTCSHSIYKHKVMDLGTRENDQGVNSGIRDTKKHN